MIAAVVILGALGFVHFVKSRRLLTFARTLFLVILVVAAVLWAGSEYRFIRYQTGSIHVGIAAGHVHLVSIDQSFASGWKTVSANPRIKEIWQEFYAQYGVAGLHVGHVALVSGLLFIACMCRVIRRAGRCERCSYDLTGNLSGICPECGHRIGLGVQAMPP